MKDNLFMPYKLQFFAEDGEADTNAADGGEEKDTVEGTKPGETETTKTFTQEELNSAIKDRLAREKKGLPTKEELKDYKDWKETQKTEEQKVNEKITAAEQARLDAVNESSSLKAQVACLKQGVLADNIDDVTVLAQRLVTEDLNIDEAIKQVVKKYPQFATIATTAKPSVTTGSQTTQTTSTDNTALRKAMGLE